MVKMAPSAFLFSGIVLFCKISYTFNRYCRFSEKYEMETGVFFQKCKRRPS